MKLVIAVAILLVSFASNVFARSEAQNKIIAKHCLSQFRKMVGTSVPIPNSVEQVKNHCAPVVGYARCLSYGLVGSRLVTIPTSGDVCGLSSKYLTPKYSDKQVCKYRSAKPIFVHNSDGAVIVKDSGVLLDCKNNDLLRFAIVGPNGLPVNF